jgi:glycine hydroxymethyltransferase
VIEMERQVVELARQLFGARYVELRALSGHVAGAAVLMGLCRPNDMVLEVGRDGGGHRLAAKLAGAPLAPLQVKFLPFDGYRYNIDVRGAVDLIRETAPRLVILGSSNFLFPHPVAQLAEELHRRPDAILAYDASHVMGFLAAGRFQSPLSEGADIVFGSTHKTLPGPQGGIIFSHRADLTAPVADALFPGLVTNHHPFRLPGLGLALTEMRIWGAAYVDQIVANARALGAALEAEGVPVVASESGYTASHTLLLKVHAFGAAEAVAERLEQSNLIVTSALLPPVHGGEGIRIGTQEITRLGATSNMMPAIARLFGESLRESRPHGAIAADVSAIAASLGPARFTWPEPAEP